jgi:outer membrane protein, heavy metal efflux system
VLGASAGSLQAQNYQRSLSSPFSPQFDIAPGFGFTNGNAILSQEVDVFGTRGSLAGVAREKRKSTEIEVRIAKHQVAYDALVAYAALLSAQEAQSNGHKLALTANALVDVVKKRVEIGEAPKVHQTRAEIESKRTAQIVAELDAKLIDAQLCVASITHMEHPTELKAQGWLPSLPQSTGSLPSIEWATSELRVAEAELNAVKKQNRPQVTVGIASDMWSLDRDMIKSRNFGFQLSLSAPLVDRGENRFLIKAAEEGITQRRALLAEAERIANLEQTRATVALNVARVVQKSYEGDVLPKAEEMVKSMQDGYRAGLITLVEVLEAQQTYNQLLRDKVLADHQIRIAELGVLRASGALLEIEVSK